MLNNKITTIGGVVYDIMFYTDNVLLLDNRQDLLRQKLVAFEYGAKVYSKDVHFTFGGGAANIAVTFANLGIKTQILGAVGGDFIGKNIIQHLKNHKIDTRLMQIKPHELTGISFVVTVGKEAEHVIFAVRGANNSLDLSPAVLQRIKTPWLYLTALGGNFRPKLDHIFAHVQRHRIKLIWNPGVQQLDLGLKKLAKYLEHTYALVVNRDEALGLLSGHNHKSIKNNINFILKSLHKSGQKLTVLTDGEKGAYVFDGQKVYYRQALKKKTINTTGAGDAFGSGFIAGLIKYGQHNVDKALYLAMANSASVVTKIGAQTGILHKKDLSKYKL